MPHGIFQFRRESATDLFQNAIMTGKILHKLHDIKIFNSAVRLTGKIAAIYLDKHLSRIIEGKKFFFIVGMGRSGTTFLARLFDKIPQVAAYHEALGDKQALIQAVNNKTAAFDYFRGYRKLLIARRLLLAKAGIYCESNSYLRYHVDALSILWKPKILHIVRDGRLVVRSMMNRDVFSSHNKKGHSWVIKPQVGDPYREKWEEMDRFAKACWYWAYTNDFLLEYDLSIIRFDDIISSYDLFLQQIPKALSDGISFQMWKIETGKPKNISRNYLFPHHSAWSEQQKRQFDAICGSTMERLGY